MVSVSSKDYSTVSTYPRALSSIIISVGLLAVFITLASWILLSNPIGDVVRSYFNEQTRGLDSPVSWTEGRVSEGHGIDKVDGVGNGLQKSEGSTKVGESRDFSLSGNVTFAQKPDNEHFVPIENKETIVKGSNDVAPQKMDFSVPSSNDGTLQEHDSENLLKTENKESIGSNDVTSQKPKSSVSSGKDNTSQVQDHENLLQTENKESTDIGSNDSASVDLPYSEISDNNA
ncbi:hypothetical protein KSS87_018069, partial [Heliosperma pusillum]